MADGDEAAADGAQAMPAGQASGRPTSATHLPADAGAGAGPQRVPTLVKARRAAVAILLAGFVTAIWVSFGTSHLRACGDLVARVGSAPLVPSCRPLSVTDAPMLAVLIVAAVLLLPELSALEIPGVIRLERQLKEQARRQDDIVAAIHRLEVSQNQQVNVLVAARVGELVGEQDEKRRRFESESP